MSMDFMGPHRLLLAIKKNPELRVMLGINVENDLRKKRFNIKYYVGCEDVISKYISDQCGLTGFTEDEILTALGLFELHGQPLQNGANALFPGLLGIKHSCTPNCYFTLAPDNSITVRASVDLRAGQVSFDIFFFLTSYRSLDRNYHLEKGWDELEKLGEWWWWYEIIAETGGLL